MHVFLVKSLISNVQPGLINNFALTITVMTYFMKNTANKNFVSWYSPLCCFIHTPCIVLNSNATFAFPTPHKSQLFSPKMTSLDQGLSSSEARSGKSLGTRLI
jgi:hypothetical protein